MRSFYKTEDGLLKSMAKFFLVFSTLNNIEQQPGHNNKVGREVSALLEKILLPILLFTNRIKTPHLVTRVTITPPCSPWSHLCGSIPGEGCVPCSFRTAEDLAKSVY